MPYSSRLPHVSRPLTFVSSVVTVVMWIRPLTQNRGSKWEYTLKPQFTTPGEWGNEKRKTQTNLSLSSFSLSQSWAAHHSNLLPFRRFPCATLKLINHSQNIIHQNHYNLNFLNCKKLTPFLEITLLIRTLVRITKVLYFLLKLFLLKCKLKSFKKCPISETGKLFLCWDVQVSLKWWPFTKIVF